MLGWSALLKAIGGIKTIWGLAAFAIVAVLYLSTRSRRTLGALSWGLLSAIVVLSAIPTIGWLRLREQINGLNSVYHVNVMVFDTDGRLVQVPLTSPIGQLMQTGQGWRIDIPPGNVPVDRKITLQVDGGVSKGTAAQEVVLENNFNQLVKMHLVYMPNAVVRGDVQYNGSGLRDVSVWILGYESEAVATDPKGGFHLPAHKAEYESVVIHAEKAGYIPFQRPIVVGDLPVVIGLDRLKR